MLKKLSELTHEENLMLLKAFASGEIEESKVDENALFAIEKQDWFLSLQMAASPGNENMNIILIGPAAEAEKNSFTIEIVGATSGKMLETIRTTK